MKRKTVLIVEDEKDTVEPIADKFERENFSVQHCSSVSEAMRRVRMQKYDCLVLDMHLEGGSGVEIVEKIRRARGEVNFRTPIVVISGGLYPEIIEKIKKHVQAVLVKPFKLSALVDKVAELLKDTKIYY